MANIVVIWATQAPSLCGKKRFDPKSHIYLLAAYFFIWVPPTGISAIPAPMNTKCFVLNWHLVGTNFAHFDWNQKIFRATSGPNTQHCLFKGWPCSWIFVFFHMHLILMKFFSWALLTNILNRGIWNFEIHFLSVSKKSPTYLKIDTIDIRKISVESI